MQCCCSVFSLVLQLYVLHNSYKANPSEGQRVKDLKSKDSRKCKQCGVIIRKYKLTMEKEIAC